MSSPVFDDERGADDEVILQRAVAENRILITNDKDFGEKVFREGQAHRGIVLLRLADERSASKIAVLNRLLTQCADQLSGRFTVVSEGAVRIG
jgi:predicted nuclease of predicted toxin-antitoxin system